jgi:hypothetical protein
MANDLVSHSAGSVEYYSPQPNGRIVEVHHHHHHYVTIQQPKSDDGFLSALKAIAAIIGGIGALLGAAAALKGANNPSTYVPQQQAPAYQAPAHTYQAPRYVSPPPPRCYLQQRREYVGRQFVGREYVGRELVYQERTPYGVRNVYRDRFLDHYQDQYRYYNVTVCE